jgi:UDP-N-acetyl-D-glucosamine dehydrogenase
MASTSAQLLARLESRDARVGVVGLGYVGLPLIVELARSGFTAVGIDLDERKVAQINAGTSYIPDVPSAEVAALVSAGRLRATTDVGEVATLDTVNICVPTPLRKTKDPDLTFVVSAVEAIAAGLHPACSSFSNPRPTRERRKKSSSRVSNAPG